MGGLSLELVMFKLSLAIYCCVRFVQSISVDAPSVVLCILIYIYMIFSKRASIYGISHNVEASESLFGIISRFFPELVEQSHFFKPESFGS